MTLKDVDIKKMFLNTLRSARIPSRSWSDGNEWTV